MWLGRILARTGNAGIAALCFREAGGLTRVSSAGYEEARALWGSGDANAAEAAVRQFLSIRSDHPEANNLLGAILLNAHKPKEAEGYLRQAIAVRPAYVAAHNNLGNVHRETLDFAAAEAEYGLALAANPSYIEALTNLGTLLNERGRYADAEPLCRKAVELAPAHAGAHSNLGNVLLNQARTGEAVAAYREALKLDPGLAEAQINLAIALGDLSYLAGALEYYEQLLEREPQSYLARIRIGMGLQALCRFDEAEHKFLEAREIRPRTPDASILLGNNKLAQGDAEGAIRCFRDAFVLGSVGATQPIAFNTLYLEDYSGQQLFDEARRWAASMVAGIRPCDLARREYPPGPLKIGYISKDFNRHSVAFFLEPLMRHHDSEAVRVFCYSNLPNQDEMTERFRKMAHAWRDIWMLPDQKVAEIIVEDGIQVLIDLSGHTSGNRLGVLAYRPAPVQVTYLGHPGTTGLGTVDYRLSDAVADREGMTETHYTETVWRLPRVFLAYQPPRDAPEPALPPCLANGHVTFGSFNNALKISKQTANCWARILTAVPNSRLLLKSIAFSSEHGRVRLRDMLVDEGIQPDRLDLVFWLPDMANHLEAYGKIDIALDTFPYNGTTTTCEALWMGVPVVSLVGDRHSGRVGASLLTALGMEDLLANTPDEYVDIAAQLATDTDRLNALRTDMRGRMRTSPLLDPAGLARDIESAYQTMWQTWCAQPEAAASSVDVLGERADGGVISLALPGGTAILVPDSLDVMTRYVLEERGDWFEDEISFVRHIVKPGGRVIDVGANYGVYSLSLASVVGPEGRVWAFEPSPGVAALLKRSAAVNNFANLGVVESAVSDSSGVTRFAESANSELSKVLDSDMVQESAATAWIEVKISTLDKFGEEFGWEGIDFIKIDAEGQEPNVVRGAAGLLTRFSPLVMAEYKHGAEVNLTMLDEFSRLGFQAYRLVPGLQLLAPHDRGQDPDPYLLNLFFCNESRANILCADGILAPAVPAPDGFSPEMVEPRQWREQMMALPYSRTCFPMDGSIDAKFASDEQYEAVLTLYFTSRQTDLPPQRRLDALDRARLRMERLTRQSASFLNRLTLARILSDFGLRDQARLEFARIEQELIAYSGARIEFSAFLAPSLLFESIPCEGSVLEWIKAAVAEWLATNAAFSSYFMPDESLQHLQIVRFTGYLSRETQRRIDLILRRRDRGRKQGRARSAVTGELPA